MKSDIAHGVQMEPCDIAESVKGAHMGGSMAKLGFLCNAANGGRNIEA